MPGGKSTSNCGACADCLNGRPLRQPLRPTMEDEYVIELHHATLKESQPAPLVGESKPGKGAAPLSQHDPPVSWRLWIWRVAHGEGLLGAHRSRNDTYNTVRRMGFWDSIGVDSDKFFSRCIVCMQYRSKIRAAPAKSAQAQEESHLALPFEDVVIDVQDPSPKPRGESNTC